MDIERDVELDYVFQSLTANPEKVGTIPLVGMDIDIRMQAAQTPGEYRVALWSRGTEPHMKADARTLNPLQFAALFGPLFEQNRKILQKQGELIAAEAEKFLKELSASE